MGSNSPYRRMEWCKEKYIDEGMSVSKMADVADCSKATIYRWLNKHGIDATQNAAKLADDHPLNSKETVLKEHHENSLSVNEIAQKYDVSRDAVKTRLDRFDIERVYHNDPDSNGSLYTDQHGYEIWSMTSKPHDEKYTLRLHRLMMLPYADPHKIFGDWTEFVIHHKNGIKWDNRYDNLEVMDVSEHTIHHQTEITANLCARFREEYQNGTNTYELGDEYDFTPGTVSQHIRGECNHEIEKDPIPYDELSYERGRAEQ